MGQICTFFMHLQATEVWHQLSATEKQVFNNEVLGSIIGQYPLVRVYSHQVDPYASPCTDILVFETQDSRQFNKLFDELSNSDMFTKPYFMLLSLIPTFQSSFVRLGHPEQQVELQKAG